MFWEEGTVCAKAWKQLLSGGRLKELSTVRVGRRKGTGTVLPAGWSLEAGPMGPAEGPDFVLSTRDPWAGYKQGVPQALWLLVGTEGEMARGGEAEEWSGEKLL